MKNDFGVKTVLVLMKSGLPSFSGSLLPSKSGGLARASLKIRFDSKTFVFGILGYIFKMFRVVSASK